MPRAGRKGVDDVDPVELLRQHRAKLAAQTSDAKRAELDGVLHELLACEGKRWMVRRAAELREVADALLRDIDNIEAGGHLKEFDRKVAPYLRRFKQLAARRRVYAGVTTAGKAGRVQHVGTETPSNTGVGSAADREKEMPAVRLAPSSVSAADDGARQLLLDALRTDVLGEAPPLYISYGDVCDDCGVPMQIIANFSLLGCPTCGKTRKYDNMTAAAVGHGTEMDYSSNTYHQKSRLVETLEYTQAKEYADPPDAILMLTMEAMWRARRTALVEHAHTIAADVAAHGEYVDAEDAVRRLTPHIPDIESILRADSRASKARRCLRDIAHSADAWLAIAHPELAGLTGKARTDAVEKFQDRIRKFYERSPKIAAYVGGYLPLQMRPDQEEYIRRLFIASGAAYDRFRKPNHQNWPGGYPFFIRSVLILLGLDEFVSQYPLPTGTKNVRDHETMRRTICEEMDWEYVPATLPLPPMHMSEEQAELLQGYLYDAFSDETKLKEPPAKRARRSRAPSPEKK